MWNSIQHTYSTYNANRHALWNHHHHRIWQFQWRGFFSLSSFSHFKSMERLDTWSSSRLYRPSSSLHTHKGRPKCIKYESIDKPSLSHSCLNPFFFFFWYLPFSGRRAGGLRLWTNTIWIQWSMTRASPRARAEGTRVIINEWWGHYLWPEGGLLQVSCSKRFSSISCALAASTSLWLGWLVNHIEIEFARTSEKREKEDEPYKKGSKGHASNI